MLISSILTIIITNNFTHNSQILNEGYLATTENANTNLIASYIKSGITIGGVEGTLESLDTSDATAEEADILSGKTAYVNGEKITGTLTATKDEMKDELGLYVVPYSNTASDVANIGGRQCRRNSSTPAIWGIQVTGGGYNGWMCISSTYEGATLTSITDYGNSERFSGTTIKGHTVYCSYMASRIMGVATVTLKINQLTKYGSVIFASDTSLTNAAKYLADVYLFGEEF